MRWSDVRNFSIRFDAAGSSDRISAGVCPVSCLTTDGVGAGVVLVAGQHDAGGVRHPGFAQVGDPLVHRGDDVRHPAAGRVERGLPGGGLDAPGAGIGQRRRDHLTGAVPPPRHPGVGGEDHRPHHLIGQRLPVAVGVVGHRSQQFAVGLVVDERDPLPRLGAERGPGQAEPPVHVAERLAGGLAPGQPVTGVVDLVEHDQRALPAAAGRVDRRPAGDLGVGGDVAVRAGRDRALRVRHLRVEHHPGGARRVGPLRPQVVGRAHHHHPVDRPARRSSRPRDRQREGRLAGARRRGQQEVPARAGVVVGRQRLPLPRPQPRLIQADRTHIHPICRTVRSRHLAGRGKTPDAGRHRATARSVVPAARGPSSTLPPARAEFAHPRRATVTSARLSRASPRRRPSVTGRARFR